MKYLSLIILVGLMYATWVVSRRSEGLPEVRHAEIQRDFQRLIADYIQKSLPQVKEITFKKFWTESLNSKEIKATFAYSFLDEGKGANSAVVEIEGTAKLKRNEKEETPEEQPWLVTDIKVSSNQLEYQQPLKIRDRADLEEDEKPAPQANPARATEESHN